MNATIQQIRPGLLITLPARGRSYKILHANGAEYWECEIMASGWRGFIGLREEISGREIQDAMSKGE